MYPCNSVNSPDRSRLHKVNSSRDWQDSGDCSQPDPQSWQVSVTQSQLELQILAGLGIPSQSEPQILAGLGTPSQSKPQILALTVRASPKLVKQMSSALTQLRVNWMSVDIGITEGSNRIWSTHSWSELARPPEGLSCWFAWPRVPGSTELVAGGGRSAALKFGRRRSLLLQISANPRRLAAGGGWGRKRKSSRSF
ncbi:hypothetical protein L3X38_009943 [Prunus dulcis]|uniref:Uncharacterized protein n=1 Tax=Prunus dulcis TaxID=3755 RepID=A0AAD4ZEB0_PRUDU|nr:hypothetical protein L3X38_009943 [Prunus dulcis]